jgi:hypothetical protein
MNKISMFLFAALFSMSGFAQITITNNDMPGAGDTIRQSTSVDIGLISFEETGNDFTWDYSTLIPFLQNVDTFVSVGETPWLYQLLFITSANLAQPGMNFDQLPGFEVTDYFNYFKNSSSDFRSVGFGITLAGIPIPNKFDTPDKIYQFPILQGNADSSYSSYSIGLPSLGYFGGWKKRVNFTDGWGTLTTPYGTFETLRIKSVVQQYDSLFLDSLGFGVPVYREFIEYKWLGNGHGLPLLTVRDDGLLQTVTYIDSVRNLTVGIPENKLHEDVAVFPNPAKESFTVELMLKQQLFVQISLYNTLGKCEENLCNQMIGPENNKLKFDIGDLNLKPGLYFVNISVDGEVSCLKLILR